MTQTSSRRNLDVMGEITKIVRDAVKDRLITSTSLNDYDEMIKTLKGPDLEDYIQTLWDEL